MNSRDDAKPVARLRTSFDDSANWVSSDTDLDDAGSSAGDAIDPSTPAVTTQQLGDEIMWLDHNVEAEQTFNQKLHAFLELKVDDSRDRNWILKGT